VWQGLPRLALMLPRASEQRCRPRSCARRRTAWPPRALFLSSGVAAVVAAVGREIFADARALSALSKCLYVHGECVIVRFLICLWGGGSCDFAGHVHKSKGTEGASEESKINHGVKEEE
jgi:hypothetical protein